MRILKRLAAPALATLLALAGGTAPSLASGERPGDFDYYALVLSWSPSFCLSGNGSHADDPQCGTIRPYAFVMHGLWPQYDKGWPESCDTSGTAGSVPADLERSMLDIMPSDKLVGHEFEKHGTCSGLGARGYFSLARSLFSSIVIPPKYSNLSDTLQVSLDDLRGDLLHANPRLKPEMIAVDCDKNGRLVEVHFCFSKDGQPRSCGRNENQAKMCRQDTLSLPPVRGHAPSGAASAMPAAPAVPQDAAPDQQNNDAAAAGSDAGASGDSNANSSDAGGYSKHRHRHRHHHSYFFYDNSAN